MSKYTTQVRFICEQLSGASASQEYMHINDVISASRGKIFENYPIFDESYRCVLETKILKHFYTKEIGLETTALWMFHLNRRMEEIMPYYNQLYESEKLEFNPLEDTDLVTEHRGQKDDVKKDVGKNVVTTEDTTTVASEKTNDTHTTNIENIDDALNQNTNNSSNGWDYFNDTPQGGVDSFNGTSDMRWLTTVTHKTNTDEGLINSTNNRDILGEKSTSETTGYEEENERKGTETTDTTNNTTINTLDEYINTIKGKQGGSSYVSLLKEFRESFLNIDMMIIEELNDLFITLW